MDFATTLNFGSPVVNSTGLLAFLEGAELAHGTPRGHWSIRNREVFRHHVARNVHSTIHRIADVSSGSEENSGLWTVNHSVLRGFAKSSAMLETTQLATAVVTA